MRISAKGRYGLAAMACLARSHASDLPVTIITISEKLGISKIYLEQVFSLLKRAGLVSSVKGSQGGYRLTRSPDAITAYDVLSAIELALLEKAAPAAPERMPELDRAIEARVYGPLDERVRETLQSVSLADIMDAAEQEAVSESLMYFI